MNAFEKIIGYETEKKELARIADVLKNPEYYSKLGAKMPNGLLINGVPGVGKTLMATALIEASERPAFVCRKDKPNGDFVNYIKQTFDKACENAPSIVFLDDMDKFANEEDGKTDAEEYVTVQSCIDEVKDKDVFVLATTNSRRKLPDSLVRVGRFDRTIDVRVPQYKDAVKIIKHYLEDKYIMKDIDPEYIAKLMHNRSCATIETLINEAAVLAGFERCDRITLDHFIRASAETVCRTHPFEIFDGDVDLENGDDVHSEITYHEAGHTVVSELLTPESVTLVAIAHTGGKTATYNKNPYDTKNDQKDIFVSLAGMAALDLKYGKKGSGNLLDLMSAKDSIYFVHSVHAQNGFSFINSGAQSGMSESLKARLDMLTTVELENYYSRTKLILAQNREFLDKVACELAEKKLLTMYDIQRIKKECTIKEADTR